MRKISKQKISLLKSQIEKAMGLLFVKGFIKKIIVRTSQVIIFRIVLLEEYIFDCESFEEIMGEIENATGWGVSFDDIKDNVMQLTLMDGVFDIYSKGWYPSNILSNFSPNTFIIDDVKCCSMEGFLQSLKVKNKSKQQDICKLFGKQAKAFGAKKFWWKITGTVFWQGQKIRRKSKEFNQLILRAYVEMFKQNKEFNFALSAFDSYYGTKSTKLVHTLGKKNKSKTILTEDEFVSCLEYLIQNKSNLIPDGHKFVYETNRLGLT